MQITNNCVVQFHYNLSDAEGNELETSRKAEPVAYLHGHQNMMAGLEKALEGRSTGDVFSVTLAPEDAYGVRKDDAEQRIPVKHLQGAKKWRPGMVARVQTDQGVQQVQIIKVGKFMATADTNHPLAGKTLTFDVEVTDVREASAEEKSHGHAHGVGGHHH